MLVRLWRKRTRPALLVGVQNGAATRESSVEGPQKLKIGLPYDPVITLRLFALES